MYEIVMINLLTVESHVTNLVTRMGRIPCLAFSVPEGKTGSRGTFNIRNAYQSFAYFLGLYVGVELRNPTPVAFPLIRLLICSWLPSCMPAQLVRLSPSNIQPQREIGVRIRRGQLKLQLTI